MQCFAEISSKNKIDDMKDFQDFIRKGKNTNSFISMLVMFYIKNCQVLPAFNGLASLMSKKVSQDNSILTAHQWKIFNKLHHAGKIIARLK